MLTQISVVSYVSIVNAFMKRSSLPAVTIELLPTEIKIYVTNYLRNKHVKNLSLVCRKLREVSLPRIFRNVRFQFSRSGFNALREFLLSDLCRYVVSLTYKVPELLHPGTHLAICICEFTNIFLETQDLKFFKENVLNPDDYIEIAKKETNFNHLSEVHVPYLLVYDTFKCICQEQHTIMESCEDSNSLSNAFRRLPQLKELCLDFCPTLKKDDWVASYMDQTISERTIRHHLQVISDALKAGRDCGISVRSIHLSNLELPFVPSSRRDSKVQFWAHFYDLLKYASSLRLSGSGSPLQVLASTKLDLQHLELCQITVSEAVFRDFIINNMNSIGFIGCHEVRLITANSRGPNFVELSSGCDCLDFHTLCVTASLCAICLKEGWRLRKKE